MTRIVRAHDEPRLLPREVVDARAEAARILDESRAEAARIVERAERDAERIAHEADLRIERARTDAVRRAEDEVAARFVALLSAAERHRANAFEEAEPALVRLAGEIAMRVLRGAFDADPELVKRHARDTLAHVRRARHASIRVAAASVPVLRSVLPDAIDVREDASLAAGDLVVESDLGTVDARLEGTVERLVDALAGR